MHNGYNEVLWVGEQEQEVNKRNLDYRKETFLLDLFIVRRKRQDGYGRVCRIGI